MRLLFLSGLLFQRGTRKGSALVTLYSSLPSAGQPQFSSSASGYPRARDVVIPLDRIDFSYARSSGPGGQNVNKLNTKAEIRFHVNSADWLPVAVRSRLQQYQSNKISKDGELIITSQEHRTQAKNKDDCLDKLKEMIAEAYVEPKDRQMWEGIGEKGKEQRREEKRKRGAVKSSRQPTRDDFD